MALDLVSFIGVWNLRDSIVGVEAGLPVLDMLILPSAMLIIYAVVTEQSVGHMCLAGIVPGNISVAYGITIRLIAWTAPRIVGAFPFALIMLLVLVLLIAYPEFSLVLTS